MMQAASSVLSRYRALVDLPPPRVEGKVTEVRGLLIEGHAKDAAIGDLYRVAGRHGETVSEVVALEGSHALLMPFTSAKGIQTGASLIPESVSATIPVSDALRGRVLDPMLGPLDGGPPICGGERRSIRGEPLRPLDRREIDERLELGVRSLDAFVPIGVGQRLGIFAGAGVGKSMLLGAVTKQSAADVVVLALVGERGREVGDFINQVLSERDRAGSVVIVATSDRPPAERLRAALVATTVAEYYRDQGQSVLLVVDSLTRFAMAQREIGLALGEPPTTKGYPPSTFTHVAQLVERAGPSRTAGSITGLYSVLVEGDDMNDPVADHVRSVLDGHVVLSRALAAKGHYPAVDVLGSLSRLEPAIRSQESLLAARKVRGWLSKLDEAADLISVGAYRPGQDPELDQAIRLRPQIEALLRQDIGETVDAKHTDGGLLALAGAQ